jgi:hypothetical protein
MMVELYSVYSAVTNSIRCKIKHDTLLKLNSIKTIIIIIIIITRRRNPVGVLPDVWSRLYCPPVWNLLLALA